MVLSRIGSAVLRFTGPMYTRTRFGDPIAAAIQLQQRGNPILCSKIGWKCKSEKSQADIYFPMTEQTEVNKVIKYNLTQLFLFRPLF